MKKLFPVVIILVICILVAGCPQPAETPTPEVTLTQEEVIACLTELNSSALQEISLIRSGEKLRK